MAGGGRWNREGRSGDCGGRASLNGETGHSESETSIMPKRNTVANTGKAIKAVLWWEVGTRTTNRVNNSTVAATNLRAPCFCLWLIFIPLYANQKLTRPYSHL